MEQKKIFIYIGLFLLLHLILLVIDRINYNIIFNLLWVSHFALLTSSIGFILRNNFILSGSLISVFIVHLVWVIDLIGLIIMGSSPTGYTSYLLDLSLYRKFLSFHHIYLSPLLLWALWKQKRISKYGWIFAAFLFGILSLIVFIFVSKDYNVNCANYICDVVKIIIPPIKFLENFSPIFYLITLNILVDSIIFFLVNILIYKIFFSYIF